MLRNWVGLSLVLLLLAANALAQAVIEPKPVVYTTAPKFNVAELITKEQRRLTVQGELTFTIMAANKEDDTLTGTVRYILPTRERERIAQFLKLEQEKIPARFERENVAASFQNYTAYPVIQFEIHKLEFPLIEHLLQFHLAVFDIPGRQNEESRYTKEEIEALLTVWARRIWSGRGGRRDFYRRINLVVKGEADQ